jgi:hypothetical protein
VGESEKKPAPGGDIGGIHGPHHSLDWWNWKGLQCEW